MDGPPGLTRVHLRVEELEIRGDVDELRLVGGRDPQGAVVHPLVPARLG